jgi:hypothetical protein
VANDGRVLTRSILNKGYSYGAITRIGRLAVGQTVLLPEATVGLVPIDAPALTNQSLEGSRLLVTTERLQLSV